MTFVIWDNNEMLMSLIPASAKSNFWFCFLFCYWCDVCDLKIITTEKTLWMTCIMNESQKNWKEEEIRGNIVVVLRQFRRESFIYLFYFTMAIKAIKKAYEGESF